MKRGRDDRKDERRDDRRGNNNNNNNNNYKGGRQNQDRGGFKPNTTVFQPLEFAAARDAEIRSLVEEMSGRNRATKRVMQTLPHHLQRRQMSFNKNKFPRKLKDAAAREFSTISIKEKSVAHRKARRRPRYLQENFSLRQRTHQWLETHIWHAKRFKMMDAWGYSIPKCPTDRSQRAAFLSLSRQCICWDNSLERPVMLKSSHLSSQQMWDVLSTKSSLVEMSVVMRKSHRAGSRAFRFEMWSRQPSRRMIGVFTAFWKPESSSSSGGCCLMLWIHASCFQQVIHLLRQTLVDTDVEIVQEVGLVRFDLMGPEANHVLQRVISSIDTNDAWTKLRPIRCPDSLPAGLVVSSRCHDPRSVMCLASPSFYFSEKEMWAAQENVVKWPADGSFARAESWWTQSDPAPVKQSQLSLVRDRAKKKLKPDQGGQSLEVLIVRNHLGGLGAGFFIVVPTAWARPFWHSLMMANAHAVGLKDLVRLHRQELAVPLFPVDYPETDAGREWMFQMANKKLEKFNRTPPGKKMNILAVDPDNFPFSCSAPPFHYSSGGLNVLRSDWRKADANVNAEETLVPITVLLMNKGHVEENAILYELNAKDEPTSRSLANHETKGVKSDMTMEQLLEREKNIWNNGGEKKVVASSNRKQIGCVLGGGVSLQRGKGFGVGFVKLSFLKAHAAEKHIHVIVRNPDTRDVRCGTISN